ncbi:MAG: 1-acyl-sn-glycerol-3-phosphate acyltransferase [Alphaproteobacteria bacterium]|nr:1-acyl-sn-glycerol-3-phosphate acyltransferase [Alphaproteobacteria bacterium]
MSRLVAGLRLGAFAAVTLPLMPVQQLLLWLWPAMARRFPMHYHRLVLRLIGVKLRSIGDPAVEPVLIVSNHVSWLDIVVLSAASPCSFIAKQEVHGWPFFGSLARLQRTVFIRRDRRHEAGKSRDAVRKRLDAGDTLVLFAEGTSSDGLRVLPFKSSLFAAADLSGVHIQPVTLAYLGHRHLPLPRRLRPFYAWYGAMDLAPHLWQALCAGPIEVTLIRHPPLHPEAKADRKSLARAVEKTVRQGLQRALHRPGELG